MRGLGAIIIQNAEFAQWETDAQRKDDEEWHRAFRVQLRNNMAEFLDSFSSKPNDIRTLADVINYTMSDPEERGEEHGIQEWLAAEETGKSYDCESQEYTTSLKRRLAMGAQAKGLLDRYQCDIYLCSASRWQPAMAGGYPTISIPIGQFPLETPVKSRPKIGLVQKAPGIPFSIVMTARRWDDQKLIEVAYAFEKAMNIRQSLSLMVEPTAEIKVTTPLPQV